MSDRSPYQVMRNQADEAIANALIRHRLQKSGIRGEAADRVMEGERLAPKQKPDAITANYHRMLLQSAGVDPDRIDEILGL